MQWVLVGDFIECKIYSFYCGETVETVSDFIFGGSKITADGDCRHEIKRCLLLGRKVMSLLFHMLSRLVIIFLPKSKRLLI